MIMIGIKLKELPLKEKEEWHIIEENTEEDERSTDK